MTRQLAACLLAALIAIAPSLCLADLMMTVRLQQIPGVGGQPDGVRITWEGEGTISSPFSIPIGTQNDLDFVDFVGTPYGSRIPNDAQSTGLTFNLSAPLTLTINPGTPGQFSQTYSQILLDNETRSDFSLLGTHPSLQVGQTFQASGSAVVGAEQLANDTEGAPLSFDDLNIGSYFTDVAADAGTFGGVKLEITAVPEASAVLGLTAILAFLRLRPARRQNL